MTPLASQIFRRTDNSKLRDTLSRCQFLECTSIYEMAMAMAAIEEPSAPYSLLAALPAELTCIEVAATGGRNLFICHQVDNRIEYATWQLSSGGEPILVLATSFTLGTTENSDVHFDRATLARLRTDQGGHVDQSDLALLARGTNGLIEKTLCIINQAGLVDRVARKTDKRVLRGLSTGAAKDRAIWHECRIRPGRHGRPGEKKSDGPSMPLHYVRKYYRPSAARWIDGYWRGDIALGTHLKVYTPTVPAELNATRHTPAPLGSIGAAH